MTRDQGDQFLRAAKEDPHGVVFAFALPTGMRPQEYLQQGLTERLERVLFG
jgi:hypothetical protein